MLCRKVVIEPLSKHDIAQSLTYTVSNVGLQYLFVSKIANIVVVLSFRHIQTQCFVLVEIRIFYLKFCINP